MNTFLTPAISWIELRELRNRPCLSIAIPRSRLKLMWALSLPRLLASLNELLPGEVSGLCVTCSPRQLFADFPVN